MKKITKTALVAIVAITFASCSGSGNTSESGTDSASSQTNSSSTITSGDTSTNVDSMRADSDALQADTSTNKPE